MPWKLTDLFPSPKPVIGMLHVPALPGSPRNGLTFAAILEHVLTDAEALAAGGVDGLIVENYGDNPFYPNRVPPHTVAFLSVIAAEVKRRHSLPLGVNVLRNDSLAAMAAASASGADFIRVNILTGARVTDQGIIEGEAHELLRYRRQLASGVRIFADVAVKHSSAVGNRSLLEEVEDALLRGGADAIIVTGSATGKSTPIADLRQVKRASGTAPIFAGSGTGLADAGEILAIADGVIAGTSFKRGGLTTNPVDLNRVAALMDLVRALR